MKIIGPLMAEHRVIERMIAAMAFQAKQMESKGQADTDLLAVGIDFLRSYADRTHHGKEEDILFRDLVRKEISPALRGAIDSLKREHNHARGRVGALIAAREQYLAGKGEAFKDIMEALRDVLAFYPGHIVREERDAFHPCLEFLSDAEQEAMLAEFHEFDWTVVHEKYLKVTEQVEGRGRGG